jgi:hypothetical protein
VVGLVWDGTARLICMRCRFIAFPPTIAIEPAEIEVTGGQAEAVEIRWRAL